MCPGLKADSMLSKISKPKSLNNHKFVIINGSKEKSKNLKMGLSDKEWFEKQGAKVIYHVYEGMAHSFPQLYYDQLAQWIQFIAK